MLAFVHIPKTAGTTLHKIISHQYSKNQIYIHHDTEGPPTQELADKIISSGAKVIMGHFSVGLHDYFPELRYITCLRDPVSRITSHYHHARNDPDHYLHQSANHLTLSEYASSGLSGELSNGMTRMIAGRMDFHYDKADESTLERAKQNIVNHFDSVLLSESFDPGVLMFASDRNWPAPYFVRRKVGRVVGSVPAPQDIEAIAKQNPLDLELHAWAGDRFAARESLQPDLPQEMRTFQRTNRHIGKAIFCLREIRHRIS